MDVVGVFKDSIEVSKKNPLVFVPNAVVMVVMTIFTIVLVGGGMLSMGLAGGMRSPGMAIGSLGALMGGAFLLMIVGMVFSLVAHGMTVAMAREAIDTGSTSLGKGLSLVMERIAQLLVATILVTVVVGIGFMLLVIPGLIASFFLMFTFVSVITENTGAVEAMKKSYETVKSHLNDAVMFFIGMIVVGFLFGIVNAVLGVIPVLGQIAGAALMGVFGGYISVVMVKVYKNMLA